MPLDRCHLLKTGTAATVVVQRRDGGIVGT
jgi:hypothetical protein